MARWHLTSSQKIHQKLEDCSEQSGLRSKGFENNNEFFIQSYSKRAIDNTNFVRFGDNWICSAGTIISNGQVGEQPLKDLFNSYVNDGLKEARSNVIGHYAIAVKFQDSITIFTDPQGSFSLYYTLNKELMISNSLSLIGKCQQSLSISPLRVIEDALQSSVPGEKTFIDGVKRLFGFQKININLTNNKIDISKVPNWEYDIYSDMTNMTNCVNEYKKIVTDVFSELEDIDSVALNTTGGLDTRTILAALLNNNIQPILIYGEGNSRLTNTKENDKIIAKKLSDYFNLEFYEMDWSDNHPHDEKTLLELFQKYGFYYSIYGAPRPLLNELNGNIKPYPTLQLGGYSPAFTNMKPWKKPDKVYSLNDLIDHYVHDYIFDGGFSCSEEYKDMVANDIRTALLHAPLGSSKNNFTLEEFVEARLFLYIRKESRFANFCNEFSYYLAPFLIKKLYDPLLNLPYNFRKNDEFRVRLINELYDDVFNIAMFSGGKPVKVNRNTSQINKTNLYRIKLFLSKKLDRTPYLKRLIKLIYQRYNEHPNRSNFEEGINDRIENTHWQYIKDSKFVDGIIEDTSNLRVKDQMMIQRNLFGIDYLNNLDGPCLDD